MKHYDGSEGIRNLLTDLIKTSNEGKLKATFQIDKREYRLDKFLNKQVLSITKYNYQEIVKECRYNISLLGYVEVLSRVPDELKQTEWFKDAASLVDKEKLKEFVLLAIKDFII